eukprot:736454-Amorphochlora_amoeboformis.AAC.2
MSYSLTSLDYTSFILLPQARNALPGMQRIPSTRNASSSSSHHSPRVASPSLAEIPSKSPRRSSRKSHVQFAPSTQVQRLAQKAQRSARKGRTRHGPMLSRLKMQWPVGSEDASRSNPTFPLKANRSHLYLSSAAKPYFPSADRQLAGLVVAAY